MQLIQMDLIKIFKIKINNIKKNQNLNKIIKNSAWLLFDKIYRMGLGLIITIIIARHLGPENFGILNYALAIIALTTTIGSLGLNNIVVRQLVHNKEDSNITLGTSFVLQLLGGLISFLLVFLIVNIFRPNEPTLNIVIAILGASILTKSTDTARYWYESRVDSKYIVIADNLSFTIFAIIKLFLVITEGDIVLFAWTIFGEILFASIMIMIIYLKQTNSLIQWRFKIREAKNLLSSSWPLILSGLAGTLYMRIDQIMLGQMLGDKEVGIYSAAVRLSEMWYFIPAIVISSTFPHLIKTRQSNAKSYYKNLKMLFDAMSIASICIAIPTTLLSDLIIFYLYGKNYELASQVLIIHVWSCVFVFSGTVSSRWFIAENLQRFSFYRAIAGCATNIILNLILIPIYGIIGSAWASLISQAVACIFFNALNLKTRELFKIQIRSLFLPFSKIR